MPTNESLFLPVLLGTGREGRASDAAARFVMAEVGKTGAQTALFDVRDLVTSATVGLGRLDPRGQPWQEAMQRADGLVIVTPEYNHGYPGELKIVLDSLYGEYAHKPVALCGVSMGPFGGVRVVEQLRQVVIELSMVPLRNAMYFSGIKQAFGADGQPADAALTARLKPLLDELLWYAQALKAARESKA
jgi:NAD(P)H-dependent FMN reductase